MVKMDFNDEERDIGTKDAAIVFREDGSLDVIIPSMDDDDTDTEVGRALEKSVGHLSSLPVRIMCWVTAPATPITTNVLTTVTAT